MFSLCMVLLLGCAARYAPPEPPPLYYEPFSAENGTDETAYKGKYSHSSKNQPLVIDCDKIGLSGAAEYTLEFQWLPGRFALPKGRDINIFEDSAHGHLDLHLHLHMSESQRAMLACRGRFNGQGFDNVSHGHILWNPREWHPIRVTGNFRTGEHRVYVRNNLVALQTSIASPTGWDVKDLAFVTPAGYIDEVRIYDIERLR